MIFRQAFNTNKTLPSHQPCMSHELPAIYRPRILNETLSIHQERIRYEPIIHQKRILSELTIHQARILYKASTIRQSRIFNEAPTLHKTQSSLALHRAPSRIQTSTAASLWSPISKRPSLLLPMTANPDKQRDPSHLHHQQPTSRRQQEPTPPSSIFTPTSPLSIKR